MYSPSRRCEVTSHVRFGSSLAGAAPLMALDSKATAAWANATLSRWRPDMERRGAVGLGGRELAASAGRAGSSPRLSAHTPTTMATTWRRESLPPRPRHRRRHDRSSRVQRAQVVGGADAVLSGGELASSSASAACSLSWARKCAARRKKVQSKPSTIQSGMQ